MLLKVEGSVTDNSTGVTGVNWDYPKQTGFYCYLIIKHEALLAFGV